MSLLDNLSNYRTILYGGDNNVPNFGVQNQQQNNSLFNADSFTPPVNPATIPQTQQAQQAQPAQPTSVSSANDLLNQIQAQKPETPTQTQKLFETPATLQPKVDQKILNTIPEGYYNKVNSQPLLNTSDLETAMQLGNLKQQHYLRDLMIGAIDDRLRDSSLNEGDRNKALAARAYYQNEQEQIHQYADMLRNASGSNVDWSNYGFGSDDNLAQTQVSLYNQQRRNLQNLLNLPTAAETEQKSFNDYRNQGYNSWQARTMAREDAERARNENGRNYANAMNFYGINSDGSLNPVGVGLVNRWAKDDPQSAGIYLQSYASPNAQFQARVNLANSMMNLEHGDWRALLGAGVDLSRQAMSKAIADQNLGYNYYRTNKVDIPNVAINQSNALTSQQRAQTDAAYKAASLANNTPLGKLKGTYEALIAFGYSPQDAQQLTLRGFLGKTLGITDTGDSAEEKGLRSTLSTITELLDNDDDDGAGSLLESLVTLRDKDPIKFYGKVDENNKNIYDGIIRESQKYLDLTSKENTTPEARVKSKEDLKIKLRSILTGRPELEIKQAIGQARHLAKDRQDKQNSSSNSKAKVISDKKLKEILEEEFGSGDYEESQD